MRTALMILGTAIFSTAGFSLAACDDDRALGGERQGTPASTTDRPAVQPSSPSATDTQGQGDVGQQAGEPGAAPSASAGSQPGRSGSQSGANSGSSRTGADAGASNDRGDPGTSRGMNDTQGGTTPR